MKILILILCVTTVKLKNLSQEKNNVTFIQDIRKWLQITQVIILYDDDGADNKERNFIFQISRLLIMNSTQTLTLKLTNSNDFNLLYEKRGNLPLITVYVSNLKSLKAFAQFSKKVYLKWAVWLIIFLKEFNSINYCRHPPERFFSLSFNSKVIVKCPDDEILHEWFSIHETQIQVNNLVNWNLKNHIFNVTRRNFLERRVDIGGKELRIAMHENINSTNSASRLYSEILDLVKIKMNFTNNVVAEESQYGTLENGKWNGLMEIISSEEADIATVGMSMSRKRMQSVDFTLPILESYKALYFKKPNGTQIQKFGYFQAFNKYVWGVLILSLMTIPMCLTYIEKKNDNSLSLLFQENFLIVWRIYCQQGISDFPKRASLRILYFVIFMLSLVLLSAYSASLISRLAMPMPKLPFFSLKEYVYQNNYKLIVIKKGETFDSINNSQDDYSKKMKNLLRNEASLPSTFSQGFNKICVDKYSVFFVEESAETTTNNLMPCQLSKVPTITQISLAMPLPKHSPYTKVINYHLHKLKENGLLSRLINKHMRKNMNSEIRSIESISLEGVSTIFEIVIYALFLSIFILIIEISYYNYIESRKRQKRNQIIALFIQRAKSKRALNKNPISLNLNL